MAAIFVKFRFNAAIYGAKANGEGYPVDVVPANLERGELYRQSVTTPYTRLEYAVLIVVG